MQRPIKPQWLLRQADELGYRDHEGGGQPRNANLRRAVSSAYYALFHHVCGTVTGLALPNGTDEDRQQLGRHIRHTAIKTVASWVTGPEQPPVRVRPLVLPLRANNVLVDVCLAFAALQEARHRADYDHLAAFSKAETLTLIDSARDAITKIDSMIGTPPLSTWSSYILLSSGV